MKQMIRSLVVGGIALVAINTSAQTSSADYYQIADAKTELVQSAPLSPKEIMDLNPGCGPAVKAMAAKNLLELSLGEVGIILDQVINLGKKVWNIVEAGKPVMNVQFDVATALPQGTQCWVQLENWKPPMSQTYRVTVTNGYGFNVVNFDYRVLYLYGGSYKNQGNYIGYATTQPSNVSVAWGFTLNAKSNIPYVVNAGTTTAPIGALQMDVSYTVSTVVKTTVQSQAYYVNGLGDFKILN